MASGEAFEKAAACYRADAEDGRADLAQARASDAAPEVKAEQMASAQATIDQSVRQEATSAYNAAFGFVRSNEAGRARPWLELARAHADMKARAEELLAFVDRR
jgi:hypothetical protein